MVPTLTRSLGWRTWPGRGSITPQELLSFLHEQGVNEQINIIPPLCMNGTGQQGGGHRLEQELYVISEDVETIEI